MARKLECIYSPKERLMTQQFRYDRGTYIRIVGTTLAISGLGGVYGLVTTGDPTYLGVFGGAGAVVSLLPFYYTNREYQDLKKYRKQIVAETQCELAA